MSRKRDGRPIFVIAVPGIFYLMMRFGCGADMVHGHGGHAEHGGADVKHVDPVCGIKGDPDQGYGKMYQGELYRFCSRNCLDQFEANPDEYLRKNGGGS